MGIVSIVPVGELSLYQRWDAEAFTPFLRSLDQKLASYPELCKLASVTHASEIPRIYTDAPDGIPFVLAQNIRPLLPDLTEAVSIPPNTAENIPVNRLHHGDVLVTRSGAFSGVSCVYLGETGKCYTSGEGLILRSLGHIDGVYLAVLLNTNVGYALCQRCLYGSGQPHVGPKYLERIRIPRLGAIEKKVSYLVRKAASLIQDAAHLRPEAEAELLERVGWQDFTKENRELCYVENSKILTDRRRMDAEHYQPMYKRLCSRLRTLGARPIRDFCNYPLRGVQPLYLERGPVFVINSKHLGPTDIDVSKAERTTEDFYNRTDVLKARLSKNDVLIYSTGAYVGRTNAWLDSIRAIASNHVTIVRPDPKVCNPLYLSLFLNSLAGVSQSEQFATGSAQRELYPWYVCQILVYIPRTKSNNVDMAWQEKLAEKVLVAAQAKVEARAKLEEAKQLVESALQPS